MPELGRDAEWLDDAPNRRFPWAQSDRRALALLAARGLMTDKDSVPYWPGWGFNVRVMLESNETDARIQMGAELQIATDERIEYALVRVRRQNGEVFLNVTIDDGDGPFDAVMSVTTAAVSLVSLQE
jgi:hypothetical protein